LKSKVIVLSTLLILLVTSMPFILQVKPAEGNSVHNIAVASVATDRTVVYQNSSFDINVTVLNEGDFTENVTAALYYNISALQMAGSAQTVTDLPSNTSQIIVFSWNTTGVQFGNYTLVANATITSDGNPPDSNTTDNTLSDGTIAVTGKGDIDGNGVVDIRDIFACVRWFGLEQGDPQWTGDISNADMNGNQEIDIIDIIMVARLFGTTYP
jgi:hypothetical protein